MGMVDCPTTYTRTYRVYFKKEHRWVGRGNLSLRKSQLASSISENVTFGGSRITGQSQMVNFSEWNFFLHASNN